MQSSFLLPTPIPNSNSPPSLPLCFPPPSARTFSFPTGLALFAVGGRTRRQLSSLRAKPEMGPSGDGGHRTLLEYAGKEGADVGDDLAVLLAHIQHACKRIAAVVASPFNAELGRQGSGGGGDGSSSSARDAPKPLDIVSVL